MMSGEKNAELRQATEADLVPWFRLARGMGMYTGFDDAAARQFAEYVALDNPWRHGRPLGIVAEWHGELIGGVLNFHLPVRLDGWTGTGVAPSAICLDERERGSLGLALINRYIAQPGYDLVFVHHVNQLGVSIMRRRKAVCCTGSNLLFSGILSSAAAASEALKLRGRIGTFAEALLPRFVLDFVGRRAGFIEVVSAEGPKPNSFLVEPEGQDAVALAALFAAVKPPRNSAGVHRNVEWMTWRYRKHPRAADFHLIGVRRGRSLVGFAVVELPQGGRAKLCDFLAEPDAQIDTLRAAVGFCYDQGAMGLEGRAGNAAFGELVAASGFKTWSHANPQCWVVPGNVVSEGTELQADYWNAEHLLH